MKEFFLDNPVSHCETSSRIYSRVPLLVNTGIPASGVVFFWLCKAAFKTYDRQVPNFHLKLQLTVPHCQV